MMMRLNRVLWAAMVLAWYAGFVSAQNDLADEPVRYDGQSVVRVWLKSSRDLQTLLALSDDPWSERIGFGGEPVDCRVAAEDIHVLAQAGIKHEVLITDVQVLVDAERHQMQVAAAGVAAGEAGGVRGASDWFATYHTPAEIQSFMNRLVADYPEFVTQEQLGVSRENRPINVLRLAAPGGVPRTQRPAALINSLQHAREWITVMTTLYLAERLLDDYQSDPETRRLLDSMEILIVPVMNPDGFAYSHTNDRLWRKNRRLNNPGAPTPVYGVDLNRNWGHEWGRSNGSSGSIGSLLYRGPAPFSEPCTAALRAFFDVREDVRLHVDVHSYSQLVLWRWDWGVAPLPDLDWFVSTGEGMRDRIAEASGVDYAVMSGISVYPASGTFPDWTFGVHGTPSFTFELRDTGQFGFLLPASQIRPTAEEVYAALRWGMLEVAPCRADWNSSGVADSQDFFDFLEAFFVGDADFSGDGVTDSQDFFDYFEVLILGC